MNSTRPGVIQFSYEALFGVSSFLKCRPEVHVAFASIRALRVRTKEAPEKFLRRSTHNLRIGRGRRQGTRPDDLEHRRLGDRKRSARSNVFENATTSKPSFAEAGIAARDDGDDEDEDGSFDHDMFCRAGATSPYTAAFPDWILPSEASRRKNPADGSYAPTTYRSSATPEVRTCCSSRTEQDYCRRCYNEETL